MEAIANVGLVALVALFVRFLTLVRGHDWDGVWKQLTAWAGGFGAVLLYANTTLGETQSVEGVALGAMSTADLLLLGVSLASIAGAAHVVTKAVDAKQTSKQPSLVGSAREPQTHP